MSNVFHHQITFIAQKTIALLIKKRATLEAKSKTSGDGTLMTRAFRGGIDSRKKARAPTRIRNWNPIRDLRGLKTRTSATGSEMGPLVDVPAMIRIEDEHWVLQRVEERHNLHHLFLLIQIFAGHQIYVVHQLILILIY